jgi:tetratricopeptide (TPR) repeat protein
MNLHKIKTFFIREIEKESSKDSEHFFKFVTIYIDIVDPKVNDITVIGCLENCLEGDKYYNNIVFNAICEEIKLGERVIEKRIHDSHRYIEEGIRRIFPLIEEKYLEENSFNIIKSIVYSTLARLYFLIEDFENQERVLHDVLNNFPQNSFVIVQQGYLFLNKYDVNDNNDKENYLKKAKEAFDNCLKLLDEKNQFNIKDPFNYDIKIEALLGLAYIEYLKGNGSNADKKYHEIERIIHSDKKQDKEKRDYLLSILRLNQGRNIIDNKIINHDRNIKRLYDEIFKIYDESNLQFQEILTKTVSIDHNNLGIYYLNEILYEEAEDHFKKSLLINDSLSHARYNLGVLYHRKGDLDRALVLIKNAIRIEPKFAEAKKALDEIDSKRKSLGLELLDWWFKDKRVEHKMKIKKIISKNIFKISLFFIVISLLMITIGVSIFELYFYDIFFHNGVTNRDVDENAFLVIIAMCFAIILLPLINKLKVGDIELELESKGSHLTTLASIGSELHEHDNSESESKLFLPAFWYWAKDFK